MAESTRSELLHVIAEIGLLALGLSGWRSRRKLL